MLLCRIRRLVARYGLRLGLGCCGRRLFPTLLLPGLDPRLRLLRLGLLILWALPALVPTIGCNNTVIMLGVLEEIFGADAVSRRERVLRQGLVFLDDLKGGSADLSFRAIALEGRATPVKTGASPVASIPAWTFVVWTLHAPHLPT